MASYSKYLLIGLPVLAVAGLAALWWSKKERKLTYKAVGRVSQLFIYPVKSCKGIPVTEAKCFKEGMEFDRRWVILDQKNNFMHQRKDPTLALVAPHFEADRYICFDAPGMKTLKVDMQAEGGEFKMIKVFGAPGEGQYVGDEASEWFSNYLKKPDCKLYRMSKPKTLSEDDVWGDVCLPNDKAAFGDYAPYMILGEGSIAALNDALPSPVTVQRFRPNILVSGLKAFEEDKWKGQIIKIGEINFRWLNHCDRCVLTTVNPETGEKKGEEPLKTLKRIRLPEDRDPRHRNSPLFGVYVSPVGDGMGIVRQGDSVMVPTWV